MAESLRDGLKLLGYDVVCTRESDISIYDKGTEGLGEQKKSDMKNRLAIFSKYSEAYQFPYTKISLPTAATAVADVLF